MSAVQPGQPWPLFIESARKHLAQDIRDPALTVSFLELAVRMLEARPAPEGDEDAARDDVRDLWVLFDETEAEIARILGLPDTLGFAEAMTLTSLQKRRDTLLRRIRAAVRAHAGPVPDAVRALLPRWRKRAAHLMHAFRAEHTAQDEGAQMATDACAADLEAALRATGQAGAGEACAHRDFLENGAVLCGQPRAAHDSPPYNDHAFEAAIRRGDGAEGGGGLLFDGPPPPFTDTGEKF